jgi:phosphoesterase RecJ-like protein
VVLTTHINADGDGIGSQTALAHRLQRFGTAPVIVNPTRLPEPYLFLLQGLEAFAISQRAGREALDSADLVVVQRLGDKPVVVVDHHPPTDRSLGDPAVRDPSASSTGELVYEMLDLEAEPLSRQEADGLYVAIATDTGSFRFSNTSVRAHEIAARLLESGVQPEAMYPRLYGQLTARGLALLRTALENLEQDPDYRIAWVTIRQADVERHGARAADLDGVVEYPRRMKGIEVAFVLRELGPAQTKVSLRSTGRVDVNAVARELGGGGHVRAAGAVLSLPVGEAADATLEALRRVMDPLED